MAGRTATGAGLKLDRLALTWLYPRLREVPPEAWASTLGKARDTEFDTLEWMGIVAGVAFVAWALGRGPVALTSEAAFVMHLLRFVLAFPLLAGVVGPFYLRRTRRGLDRELARKGAFTANAEGPSKRTEA